jgi:transposase-like protein
MKRNCPKCNKEIVHKSAVSYKRALKSNRICKSCAHLGKTHSEETLEKMSKLAKNQWDSAEIRNKTIENMRGRVPWNKGKTNIYSEETLQLMSEANSGRSLSQEHKNKLSDALSGRKLSGEHKRKISQSHIGKVKSITHRRNIGIAFRGKTPWIKGRVHDDVTKTKMRLKRLEWIENNLGQPSPVFNPIACKIIDEYGKLHGYNFRHAMNGGEYHIKELGYFLDGYDEEQNVAIEYYEGHHFINGRLKDRDVRREREIKTFLGCKLIRLTDDVRKQLIEEVSQ